MLRDGSIREPQRARALETIERNAVTQLALIEEMVDVARMTSGQLVLELGIVDLAQLTAQTVEAVRPAALAKQVTLFAAVEPDVAPLSGDPGRLRQIVHQLVSDALSCTPTEGVVTVSLSNVGSQVELAITDTGSGDERRGTGPALAIVRHLVELHEGTMRVDSSGGRRRLVVSMPTAGRIPRTDDEVR
jgi:signal transduction histidine kinase